jgi:hypothetical protein
MVIVEIDVPLVFHDISQEEWAIVTLAIEREAEVAFES